MAALASFAGWCVRDEFYLRYAADLRTPLFAAMFVLAAFLFALTAFLVSRLKTEVLDSPSFRRLIAIQRVKNPNLGHYGPLRRLCRLLFSTSMAASVAAALQITLGLARSNLAALACVGSALVVIGLLALLPLALRENIQPWLHQIEKDAILSKSRGGSASFDPPSGGLNTLNPSASGRMPILRGDGSSPSNPSSGATGGDFY
jgi:hypothetical protein